MRCIGRLRRFRRPRTTTFAAEHEGSRVLFLPSAFCLLLTSSRRAENTERFARQGLQTREHTHHHDEGDRAGDSCHDDGGVQAPWNRRQPAEILRCYFLRL